VYVDGMDVRKCQEPFSDISSEGRDIEKDGNYRRIRNKKLSSD
jgi:hypothetical protein